MTFEEYRKCDAVALAQLVKKKEVSPTELLATAIKRAEEVNPKLNAVVTPLYDMAREQIKNLDMNAPLAGVPYLIKDLGPQLKGARYTMASKLLKDYVSTENSEVTNRMLKGGLVIFGKTNSSEFGLTPYVENELFGPAYNPWNTAHTTGGSSGGSGAAVAAGIVPMASANDGGGSIRIPASCNGLFGLKPTRGRVTLGPQIGISWNGATCEGAVSRSVRDSAVYLDMIEGSMDGDPYIIQKPERPYADEVNTAPGKLKIGYSYQMPEGMNFKLDEENIKAIGHTVKLLRDLGHEVTEVPLPYKKEVLSELLYNLVLGELAASLDYISELRGQKTRYNEVEPNTWLMSILGQSHTSAKYAHSKMKWNEVSRALGAFHRQYNLLLTPTLGMKPFKTGALQNSKLEDNVLRVLNAIGISGLVKHTNLVQKTSDKIYHWIAYPPLANITGQPSATLPLHWSSDGLPVGIMFTAGLNDEATLFRIAAQLEKAQPWFDKVPM